MITPMAGTGRSRRPRTPKLSEAAHLMSPETPVRCFSTESLPREVRFDYWMSILQQSLWPVSEWSGVSHDFKRDFTLEMSEASLGGVSTIAETITAHRSHRTRTDVESSGDRCYLLFANQLPWDVAHHGHCECLLGGDLVLVDSQDELETYAEAGFDGVILKLPVEWVRTWLPNPSAIVGRRISSSSGWGRAFSPIVSQVTPEIAAAPPLPHVVLVDQVGAVLAMIAGEVESRARPDVLEKIRECIRQRCSEPGLAAADVAASLNIPSQTVHRILAASDMTFASQLIDARMRVALRMLTSPAFNQLTTLEIARKAGFLKASHFARVVRRQTGRTPLELRHPSCSA